MQYISEKWLKIFNAYYVLFTLVLSVLYIYFAYQQKTFLVTDVNQYGISIATGIFAITTVIYNIVLLRPIKKSNVWLAYLISFALFALANNAAAETSLQTNSSYIFLIQNVLLAFTSTMFGPIIPILILGIVGVVFAMTVAGTSSATKLGVWGDAMLIVTRIVGVTILLFLFKDKYQTVGQAKDGSYVERYLVDSEVVRLLTDSISDGVMITDEKGIIKSANPGAGRLLQEEPKDMIDLDYRSVLSLKTMQHTDIGEQDNPVAQVLAKGEPQSQEVILVLKNRKELYADVVASAIKDKTSSEVYGSVIIFRDVSKKKQEENARSEFISTASHEMRTPVAAIEGYLALALNENVAKIDDKARGFLQKAHLSTEHLGRLFQDLLVSAKAEDGRLVSHPEVLEMGSFLEQLSDDLRLITSKKGLGLEYITGSGGNKTGGDKGREVRPLYYVYADPDRLREIITNLFDNAVKYTDKGNITIGLTGNKEVVQFFIRDTGAGIPADDVPHLFQKFYRVDNRTTRTTGGTGLGLFISRKILELYNGRIWVESEVGKGSTFFANLPRIDSSKVSVLQSQPSSSTSISIGPSAEK